MWPLLRWPSGSLLTSDVARACSLSVSGQLDGGGVTVRTSRSRQFVGERSKDCTGVRRCRAWCCFPEFDIELLCGCYPAVYGSDHENRLLIDDDYSLLVDVEMFDADSFECVSKVCRLGECAVVH